MKKLYSALLLFLIGLMSLSFVVASNYHIDHVVLVDQYLPDYKILESSINLQASITGYWSATGAFTQAIVGLIGNTTYYTKAYATNSSGTNYGAQVSFTMIMAPTGNSLVFDGVV